MKKIYYGLFFLLLCMGQIKAQQLSYKQFFPLRVGESAELVNSQVQQIYRLSSNEQILISDIFETNSNYGLHLIYSKRADGNAQFQEVFRSHGAMESTSYNPSFFRASDNSIIIVCSAGSQERAWGEHVFLLENDKLQELGKLDIVLGEEGKYRSILPNLKISKEGEKIYFRVDAKLILASDSELGHQQESHAHIEYVYENGELRWVK